MINHIHQYNNKILELGANRLYYIESNLIKITHIDYKVLWLKAHTLGATLRGGSSQICFPGVSLLLIEERKQESKGVTYFILAVTLDDI